VQSCDAPAVVVQSHTCFHVNTAMRKEHTMRKRGRGMTGAIISVSAVCVMLATAEWTARFLGLRGLDFVVYPTPTNCLQRSKLLGMEFAPNCDSPGLNGVGVRFHTNSLGLRDDEVEDDGSIRIL